MKRYPLLIAALLIAFSTYAQDAEKKEWDVTDPGGTYEEVSFTTDEGTWMNVDVSPDGKHIAFDMLGDIYIMPVTGGKAEVLREGLAYEIQPRFSPDGSQILFTSDAGGGDNIWVMNRDGSDARQITKEDFRLTRLDTETKSACHFGGSRRGTTDSSNGIHNHIQCSCGVHVQR